jgi:hypothetical protein
MTKLKNYQREGIRNWFCPEPGYVLDFSNRTFAEFFEDHFDINIYADAFSEKGTSKFNRLLAFIELSPPHLVIELLNLMWKRLRSDRDEELEQMAYQSARDEFTVDLELVRARHDSAKQEDEPFVKIISELGTLPSHTAVPHLERMNAAWNLDTVDREYRRAIDNVEKDPEAAVTAACSMIESICRSILKARTDSLPNKKDIKTLYKEVRDVLGLSPNKEIPEGEAEGDVRGHSQCDFKHGTRYWRFKNPCW